MVPVLTTEEYVRYSRHLLIPEIGLEGQVKLKTSSALIVGTGGLGSPVALYLAAAGVGRIGIVDFDQIELSNLQRQVIHGSSSIGDPKVVSARKRMLDLNPAIEVRIHDEMLSSNNAMRIASEYDVVIDGTDNFPARYLINDLCVFLGIPNVYGSVFQFDGQASVFYSKEGPCYRCLFPEPPPPGLVPSCADGGVMGVVPGTIGIIQATETIKLLIGIGSSLVGRLLIYNALDMTFDFVNIKKNPICRICGSNPDVHGLIDYMEFCGSIGGNQEIQKTDENWTINPPELREKIDTNKNILLIDVREPHELEISHIKGALMIPFGQLVNKIREIDPNKEIIVFCRTGSRSKKALEILKSFGYKNIKNLNGGINAWADEIDPSMPIY
jgi:molybdopterin/thiamine biosynthesis adenylyltransferase/rhodanese-related sulfurtransferase